MPNKQKYDWEAVQQYYDGGHSIRECQERFGFGNTARIKAIKAGRLVTRKQKKVDPTSNPCSKTTSTGEIACAKFDLRATEKGIVVSRPNVECAYDRIADCGGVLYKVQIKFSSAGDEHVVKSHVHKNGRERYSDKDIDVIVVYSPIFDKLYWLPKNVWLGKITVNLRCDPVANGNDKNCNWAREFEW